MSGVLRDWKDGKERPCLLAEISKQAFILYM